MIPLFFALADTIVAPVDPADLVVVTEWGIVEIDRSACLAVGAPEGPSLPLPVDPSYCVEAPVVWFQGADFSGTFTVETPGRLTVTYPFPDAVEEGDTGMPSTAVWRLAASSLPIMEQIERMVEESPAPAEQSMGHFGWAADIWREVRTHFLHGTGSVWMERFLYYECLVDDLFDAPVEDDADWPFGGMEVPAMVFRTGTDGAPEAAACRITGTLPGEGLDFAAYDRGLLLSTLCAWSIPGFGSDRLEALADTWETRFTTVPEGAMLIVFPIPGEYHDRISTISLRTDQELQVAYKRLFLGMVTV